MIKPSDASSRDMRRYAPATSRNREPILNVLKSVLPIKGSVLEIASGTGEHVAFLAQHFPILHWQPTDADPDMLPSINAWIEKVPNSNLNILPPLQLNTCVHPWPVERADAIMAINMVHISPWASCEGLMEGAGRILSDGGVLYLYGPFIRDGQHTAASNVAFDESLRQRDPNWGVRDLTDVVELASGHGLILDQTIPMPANNLSLVFRRV